MPSQSLSITIRFFALARDLAGSSQATLCLRPGTNVGAAITALLERFPSLREIEPRLATAVNQTYVKRDHTLRDGDELALIPPVSGG